MVRSRLLTALALVAGFVALDAASPAAAQPWGWGPPPRHHRWDGPPPRRCWMEERRVRVDTPWGPRWRIREVRVCR
ncbi:hypothetical protein EYW49_14395 [Siculibacillus lacustris]|uniref:Uncharacterized protein n=1 Tax=Siculibacillus lacustris TaxID=1549641 RepID=A0A4Q9VLL8_9HYPH|nr:hypothetical protein [Siculibacillus lacustris]TBW36291.1 hypothetical protein EYW49_14395 [Siculibacillus lacustris]